MMRGRSKGRKKNALAGVEAQALELVGGGFDFVHFAAAEDVAGAFVPVEAVARMVVDQSLPFDAALPVGPGPSERAVHYSPPLAWAAAVDPNPLRTTAPVRAIGAEANGWAA